MYVHLPLFPSPARDWNLVYGRKVYLESTGVPWQEILVKHYGI